ncbi:MAG: biopolymer transporter ExbD [Opitutaceae bacterium]
MRTRRRSRQPEEFQMAPMIDMVFLLLVFFMCVSSLAQATKTVPVELPESGESEVPDDLSNRGIVSVMRDGSVFVGASPVTLDRLGSRLRSELGRQPDLKIQVRADGDAPFSVIKPVLKICGEAGATEIIYATHQLRNGA